VFLERSNTRWRSLACVDAATVNASQATKVRKRTPNVANGPRAELPPTVLRPAPRIARGN
jgi:hypothetical protein